MRRIGSRTGVGEGQGTARSLLGIAATHIRPLGAAQAVRGERVGARELEGHRLAVEDRVRGRAHLRQRVHRRSLHGLGDGHRARRRRDRDLAVTLVVDGECERQDPLIRPVGVLHGHVRDDVAAVRILDGLQDVRTKDIGLGTAIIETELDLRLAAGR